MISKWWHRHFLEDQGVQLHKRYSTFRTETVSRCWWLTPCHTVLLFHSRQTMCHHLNRPTNARLRPSCIPEMHAPILPPKPVVACNPFSSFSILAVASSLVQDLEKGCLTPHFSRGQTWPTTNDGPSRPFEDPKRKLLRNVRLLLQKSVQVGLTIKRMKIN